MSCLCSTTALRSFVKDITIITLRHQQPHALLRQRKARHFSTRPALQQLEAAISRQLVVDDGFVPFTSAKELRTEQRHAADMKTDGVAANDWHAELEIVPQQARSEEKKDTSMATLDGSTSTEDIDQSLQHVEATLTVPTAPPNDEPMSGDKTRREESRLKRKQRRLVAGQWKPSAQAELSDATKTQTVLGKIDAMQGPSIPCKKAKAMIKTDRKSRVVGADAGKRAAEGKAKGLKITKTLTGSANKKDSWMIQKAALANKFGEAGWQPRKRLSPDTLEGIRALHKSDTVAYSTSMLAEHFEITPEAIRRILKSKWRPNEDEIEERRQRWEKRGVQKWEEMSEKGSKPPAAWRAKGVRSPAAKAREQKVAGEEHVPWTQDTHISAGELAEDRVIRQETRKEDGYVQWAPN